MAQVVTRNVILCGSATERFSEKQPVWSPPSPEDSELCPIDVLYGGYDPNGRLIEVFVRNIKQDAGNYGGSFEDLLQLRWR